MSQEPISRSRDLARLQAEGYSLETRDGYLIIHHVVYLNCAKQILSGILVMPLTMSGNTVIKPSDHTASWCGERPCYEDGTPIASLVNSESRKDFGNGITGSYYLSCHLDGREYSDYYEKVHTYVSLISTPARQLDPVECRRIEIPSVIRSMDSGPFLYMDTNSSRANLVGINTRLKGQVIGIVGMGGTGSYLLDFIAKTPVKEIHIYDGDEFNSHNAFRAPGAASEEDLSARPMKVDYFSCYYSRMRNGIIPHPEYLIASNTSALESCDFVFICVDSKESRTLIADYLVAKGIPFIDSGIGLNIVNDRLIGQTRVTSGFKGNYSHIKDAFSCDADSEDVYSTNIQVSEINALAAIFAVMKWKKQMEYYADTSLELNSLYSIDTNTITHSNYGSND